MHHQLGAISFSKGIEEALLTRMWVTLRPEWADGVREGAAG